MSAPHTETTRARNLLDRIAWFAIALCACSLLLEMRGALRTEPPREQAGSTITFDFTNELGTFHVLTQIGTADERQAAIERLLDDGMALMAAAERRTK